MLYLKYNKWITQIKMITFKKNEFDYKKSKTDKLDFKIYKKECKNGHTY
jgi:hypothetical protein